MAENSKKMSSAHLEVTSRIEAEKSPTSFNSDDHGSPKSLSADPSELLDLPEDSDDDNEAFRIFRVDSAWRNLLRLPGCLKLMVKEHTQKMVGIAVGVNVSQEFPWKQIKFKVLDDHLFDNIDNGQLVKEKFTDFQPDDLVLIGYMPVLTQDNIEIDERDPFITYVSHESAAIAGTIIKNIDAYEKWTLNKILTKTPGYWLPLGSEAEVDEGLRFERTDVIDIEIQSIFPITTKKIEFNERLTSDVRDGYVELVPGDKRYDNIFRKRVDSCIQAAPNLLEIEQQTDPTFPTNSWSQYLYELKEEIEVLDVSSEEEDEQKQKPNAMQVQKLPPEVSTQIEDLLETLEFNQVDMYRNDYPLISSNEVSRHTNPFLEEVLCFADISKSLHRYVCGLDWYPTLSGLITVSYTYSTQATSLNVKDRTDTVQRSLLSKHPVLMWSFADSLNPKLEFESPREVTSLSFCPYSPNILIGGTMNGQIILWDLMDRVEKLDFEEMLTPSQAQYRVIIGNYLKWMKQSDEQFTVFPSIVSALDTSQSGPISGIKWLPTENFITSDGKMHSTPKSSNRFFITNSVDSTIAFWNLDINLDKKTRQNNAATANLPSQLCQSESPFKKYDGIFKPVFIVACPEPIVSSIYEIAKFTYTPINVTKAQLDFAQKFKIEVAEIKKQPYVPIRHTIITEDETTDENAAGDAKPKTASAAKKKMHCLLSGTFFGSVVSYYWDGFEFDLGNPVNKATASVQSSFASCHDGPIVAIDQNPYCPEIFATVGRFVLALWKEDFENAPVFWRKRPCEMTDVKWSYERPSVLYITRTDGFFEAWDILARDDDTCLSDVLGGGIITTLSEHRPSVPRKILGIGDYNSSYRLVVLPSALQNPIKNEKSRFENYVRKELERKRSIYAWEKHWFEQSAELRSAKKEAEAKARKEMEALKQKAEELAAREEREAALAAKKNAELHKKKTFDLPEKLEKRWDEINLKRLLDVLMSRKMVNAEKLEKQTALEKSHLAYERNKKLALKRSMKRIDEDLATVRARILPTDKDDVKRTDIVLNSVDEIVIESATYNQIESECIAYIEESENYGDVDFGMFFDRGLQRRQIMTKSMGMNTTRGHLYKLMKNDRKLSEMDMGYNRYLDMIESNTNSAENSHEQLVAYKYNDLDEIPVRDDEPGFKSS